MKLTTKKAAALLAAVSMLFTSVIFTSCQGMNPGSDPTKQETEEEAQKGEEDNKADEVTDEKSDDDKTSDDKTSTEDKTTTDDDTTTDDKTPDADDKTSEDGNSGSDDKTSGTGDETTSDDNKTDDEPSADSKDPEDTTASVATYNLIPAEDSSFVIKYTDGEYCELTGIVPDATTYKTGDQLKFVITGKADKALENLRIVFVDCAADTAFGGSESYGYNILAESAFEDAASIAAHTDFEKSVTLTLTADQIGSGSAAHRVRIYCDGNDTVKIYPQGTDTEAKLAADIAAAEAAAASGETVIFSGSQALDWSDASMRVIISAADVSSITEDSVIIFDVEIAAGSDCTVQIQDGSWTKVLSDGTITGGTAATGNTFQISENGTVTYKPSADELELIKANGFVAFGQGTIKKISIK